MLEELEASYLTTSLEQILASMVESIPAAREQYGAGVLGPSVLDADYFLTVARSLLAGKPVDSVLNQNERVAEALWPAAKEQIILSLSGRAQFCARGPLASPGAGRYIRAIIPLPPRSSRRWTASRRS
jgi:hypothetical protein